MTISMDDLEQSCWECEGKGVLLNEDKQEEPCPKCQGKGAILTAQGQTLLHFIKKHL
ncbi:tryptophan RNA-binding attenuation protein [Brevibacillus sp. 179-C9.3 HS]|uniref:tryptophan RNA-binding attenuation protein n=1 Tax=unclassified Brevibacillus TaxID=2684853 RepID=UPI0039A0128B